MGQKIYPVGPRLGITEVWRSRWFERKNFADTLAEDIRIREFLTDRLKRAAVSRIDIERKGDQVVVEVFTARPVIVNGKKGSEVDALRKELEKLTGHAVAVNIVEIKRPELDATLVAQNVAEQLEARVGFRRAMKRAVTTSMKAGALGVRLQAAGRLGGSEMGRREWYREGRVPLHTLRARIDYGAAEAATTAGRIGVKVWIYKGELLPGQPIPSIKEEQEKLQRPRRAPRKGGRRDEGRR
jgi:small subunit ribosomal protein S3